LASGDDDFANTWKSLGSFNLPHPTISGVRIISINGIFFSQLYDPRSSCEGRKTVSSNGGTELTAWLDKNLAVTAQAEQKVWLMFHIPPGIDGYPTAMKSDSPIKRGSGRQLETCSKSIIPMWIGHRGSTICLRNIRQQFWLDLRLIFIRRLPALIGTAGAGRKFVLLPPGISPIYGQKPDSVS
jgi:hypothetical protein